MKRVKNILVLLIVVLFTTVSVLADAWYGDFNGSSDLMKKVKSVNNAKELVDKYGPSTLTTFARELQNQPDSVKEHVKTSGKYDAAIKAWNDATFTSSSTPGQQRLKDQELIKNATLPWYKQLGKEYSTFVNAYGDDLRNYSSLKDFEARGTADQKAVYNAAAGGNWWEPFTDGLSEDSLNVLSQYSSYDAFLEAVKNDTISGELTLGELRNLVKTFNLADSQTIQNLLTTNNSNSNPDKYSSSKWDPTDPVIYVTDEALNTVVKDGNDVCGAYKVANVLGYDGKKFFFKSVNYSRMTYDEKKEFITVTLKSIKTNVKSSIAKTKAYNFIKERDGDMEAAVKLVAEDTTADLNAARSVLKGVLNKIGVVVGVLTVLIFAMMALTIVADLTYIVIPAIRMWVDRGDGKKRPLFVSAEAWKAVVETERPDVNTSALSVYFKKRVVMMVSVAIVLSLVASGRIYSLMGWIIDSFSRIVFS